MKILFVCTGNICRSPLAEGILRKKSTDAGIACQTDSCGFEKYHVGDAPDHRAQKVATQHGVDISRHRARLFRVEDFDRFDKIYVMDEGHYRNLERISRHKDDLRKVDFLMNVLTPGANLEVEDPWYDGMEAFYQVFDKLDIACEALVSKMKQHHE